MGTGRGSADEIMDAVEIVGGYHVGWCMNVVVLEPFSEDDPNRTEGAERTEWTSEDR